MKYIIRVDGDGVVRVERKRKKKKDGIYVSGNFVDNPACVKVSPDGSYTWAGTRNENNPRNTEHGFTENWTTQVMGVVHDSVEMRKKIIAIAREIARGDKYVNKYDVLIDLLIAFEITDDEMRGA